ncbi:MAG: hemolysin family protein [Psychroflexus sp.]|nr:hemolysin family protein [Psychroflexus sp.]MDR9447952.1 hemolysin family protein [Psychroflexus sp.]
MEASVTVIVTSLLLSAFFSGMEIAFVSANKVYIELEKNQNQLLGKTLKVLTKKPSKFIATMLIGNNVALVVYGFFMGDVIMQWLAGYSSSSNGLVLFLTQEAGLLTKTLISTLLILTTAEFFPKVFFQIYANTLLKIFSIPAYIFYQILSFLSDFVVWLSDFFLKKIIRADNKDEALTFSKVELGHYIDEQMETFSNKEDVDAEIQFFQNALQFSEVKAREVMVPRNEIVAVDKDEDPQNLIKLFSETGLSKILVYQNDKDDILGYIHSFDLFDRPQHIIDKMIPAVFMPETVLVKDALNALIKKQKSIAVIVDEYGGTSGMMTVEDIVEELFGEIEDEHDPVTFIEEKIDDYNYRFSARLEVDYINETYSINIPDSEQYETLGGFIVSHTETIPEIQASIVIKPFQIEILEASSNKIDLIHLKILDSEDKSE